jgi:GR25 family glycosyltransferase involved in LPS biosynthesis
LLFLEHLQGRHNLEIEMALATYVITLDPQSNRFKSFTEVNKHLRYNVFVGVRGTSVSPQDRVMRGLLTADCASSGRVTDGMLGCALSHWSLWQEAIKSNSGLLILEDDVIVHPGLSEHVATLASRLPDADIVLFGLNTNSVMDAQSPQGLRQVSTFYELYPSHEWIQSALARTTVEGVVHWRLFRGFGTSCYFITGAGARRLSSSLFPLRLDGPSVPLLTNRISGIELDRRMNAMYDVINAYISVPFLAYTPNIDSSTKAPPTAQRRTARRPQRTGCLRSAIA